MHINYNYITGFALAACLYAGSSLISLDAQAQVKFPKDQLDQCKKSFLQSCLAQGIDGGIVCKDQQGNVVGCTVDQGPNGPIIIPVVTIPQGPRGKVDEQLCDTLRKNGIPCIDTYPD